jgi:hypothetical protein
MVAKTVLLNQDKVIKKVTKANQEKLIKKIITKTD